ncbi:YqjF family protein [Haloferula rosea]|nr:DUF2071 domain-containing protein [Haloferula rosea]
MRDRPIGRPVMSQRWANLLFLHWQVDPEELSPHLPEGLHLDLHEGNAWLGIVPFHMQRIRPSGLLPLPWLSWFLELNVRTYVHDEQGNPGVWFFSLDCDQPLAVEFARRSFHLPYQHASMKSRNKDGSIHYSCRRRGEEASADYVYQATGPRTLAKPGSLEFFLAERYLLISHSPDGSLRYGRVHHSPYQLAPARCEPWSALPAEWNGIHLPDSPPHSTLWADPVDVSVFPLRPAC